MEPASSGPTILVAGDVTLDWNIAHRRIERVQKATWTGLDFARACPRPGGAALLHGLLATMTGKRPAADGRRWTVRGFELPDLAGADPCDGRVPHSYAVWEPVQDGPNDPEERWRVAQFLGREPGSEARSSPAAGTDSAAADADLYVLDDAALGFRDAPERWEPLLDAAARRDAWIVVKMVQPVAHGPLWDRLVRQHADRLMVVLTIADLRQTAVLLSRQISWEQTAEDLIWELTYNPAVNGLSRCAGCVVSLDTAGAVLLRAQPSPPAEATLLFDPEFMEGEWAARFRGGMIGTTATLTASIVRALMDRPDAPDVARGIRWGIRAARRLLRHGYHAAPLEAPLVSFPTARVADDLCAEDATVDDDRADRLVLARIRPLRARATTAGDATAEAFPWTILGDAHREGIPELAVRIVQLGLHAAVNDVPIAHFAHLYSLDRREIEALRSIRALIAEYCERVESRPLSIAVFGPPGAGKSFAVKQVAAAARPGAITELTFNLSQVDGPAGLLAALHQVRDVSLRGKLPLVFWDEFDAALGSERLGWLRYFLAPMQDGEFLEGQLCHPVGRAIFVFAGGTASRLAELGGKDASPTDLRNAKVPDFVSRLRGVLEILGPDPRGSAEADPFFVVRRAILLRSLLERGAPQLFLDGTLRIDLGVLWAFLAVPAYRHGARSMESLVAMSQLADRTAFVQSALPPESQLALHVDPAEFLALVHRLESAGPLFEAAAIAFHEAFCEALRARGFRFGHKNDEKAKINSALRPFAELPEDEQEQNRAVVRDLPRKFAQRGYVLMPNRRDTSPIELPPEDVDALAVEEHRRWMAKKLADGWRPGKKTDKDAKVHKALVEFHRLPKGQQDKARQQVRDTVRILARVGYAIVRVRD